MSVESAALNLLYIKMSLSLVSTIIQSVLNMEVLITTQIRLAVSRSACDQVTVH